MGEVRTTAVPAWAEIEADRMGLLRGTLVGFDHRTAVVSLPHRADLPLDRAIWLTLGLEGEQAERVLGAVRASFDQDGAQCVVIDLADTTAPSGADLRRRVRVALHERVEALGISDRPGPDPFWRGTTFDVSSQGLGALMTSPVPVGTLVLLRFRLPPHRAAFQVRARVRSCERESAESFRTGFLFERLTAGHAQQLHAAVLHMARQ
jgi:hypothetical protein